MIKKIFLSLGIFCLACTAIPAAVYGIFNTGVWAMAALCALFLILFKLWDKINVIKPLRNTFVILFATGGVYVILMSAVMTNRAYYSAPPDTGELAVVVLGGGIIGDKPSLMLRRRLDKAYDYMLENESAVCVVTGGQGPDEMLPESHVMRNYLISRGVSPEKILFEDKSLNTQQNFEFAAELLPQDTVAVISTDGFHQLRASIFADAAGLNAPYSVSSLTPWGLLPTYWLRELLGVPVALLLAA